MENQNKQPPPPPPSQKPAALTTDGHISLSPPLRSPQNSISPADSSYSSPLHSKQYSSEHISLSPSPPGNSPARSDHINFNHSPQNDKLHSPSPPPEAVVRRDVYNEPVEHNRIVLEEPTAVVHKATAVNKAADLGPAAEDGGGRRRYNRPSLSILRGAKKEKMVKKAALGFRVFGLLFCLISFSVMAADRNQGWAVDSFDRYREFRYCMFVNVIGFVYSAAQAFDLWYNLATGKYIGHHQKRYSFDFAADQIIAYLLISASSSAAIRVNDWESNWGKDKFPDMATASISMSFLAFFAIAISSLISGYALCTSKSV